MHMKDPVLDPAEWEAGTCECQHCGQITHHVRMWRPGLPKETAHVLHCYTCREDQVHVNSWDGETVEWSRKSARDVAQSA